MSRFLGLPQVLLVSARSLNSKELLACPSSLAQYKNEENDEGRVGAWDVTFRSSWWSLLLGQPNNCHPMDSLVFPAATKTITLGDADQRQHRHRKRRRLFPTFRRYDKCKLLLFSNGTFEIAPPRVDETSSSSNLLAIHGKWKVQSNPYCATDRFFHQICLESYPRLQTTTTIKSTSNHDSNEPEEPTLQQQQKQRRIKFQLHCRLLGHYSAGRESGILMPRLRSFFLQKNRQSHYHAKGQMVRGTMLLEEDEVMMEKEGDLTNKSPLGVPYQNTYEDNDNKHSASRTREFFGNVKQSKKKRRIVLASFTAQRRITFQELQRLYDDDEDDEDEESLLSLDGK